MTRNISVVGIYPDGTTVSDAVDVLQRTGYRAMDISVLSSDNQGSKDFGHHKRTKALEGAAAGAAVGAVAGAILALVASMQFVSTAALAPLVAAGPVLAAMAGAACGGALGWFVGLLTGMRLPEYVAKRYSGRIRRGGILLSVHCDSPEWSDRAKRVLKDTGARDISAAAETTADFGMTDKPTEKAPAAVADRVHERAPQTAPYIAQEDRK
ncbi:MAG TPA: general stress protein [Terriglobales bacterium]|nr:general stress protein [Terriglobales bacterium]